MKTEAQVAILLLFLLISASLGIFFVTRENENPNELIQEVNQGLNGWWEVKLYKPLCRKGLNYIYSPFLPCPPMRPLTGQNRRKSFGWLSLKLDPAAAENIVIGNQSQMEE